MASKSLEKILEEHGAGWVNATGAVYLYTHNRAAYEVYLKWLEEYYGKGLKKPTVN